MERKHLIIISLLVIIIFILIGALFSVLTHNEYERIEVVPNGTSMELPINNLTNYSDVPTKGFKIWSFEQGNITSFNTKEVKARFHGTNFYSEKGLDEFNELKNTILKNYEETDKINEYYIYTVNSEILGDVDGKTMYVIFLCSNDKTGDNIIIMADNKDITLNIAKSVDLKMGDLSVYKAEYTEWVETSPTVPITKNNDGSLLHEEDYANN